VVGRNPLGGMKLGSLQFKCSIFNSIPYLNKSKPFFFYFFMGSMGNTASVIDVLLQFI
jgi:hypothetical protein